MVVPRGEIFQEQRIHAAYLQKMRNAGHMPGRMPSLLGRAREFFGDRAARVRQEYSQERGVQTEKNVPCAEIWNLKAGLSSYIIAEKPF